jgi:hypothetical protein
MSYKLAMVDSLHIPNTESANKADLHKERGILENSRTYSRRLDFNVIICAYCPYIICWNNINAYSRTCNICIAANSEEKFENILKENFPSLDLQTNKFVILQY